MDRRIVCVHVPCFEIALARLEERRLKRWPVAVASIYDPRAFLLEVSQEARAEGIYPGMRVTTAQRICPSLHLLAPDPRRVRLGQNSVNKVINHFTPTAEIVGRGRFYLDLTGSARLFGQAAETAARIRNELARKYGLHAAFGVAKNKLVSGVAANLLQHSSIYDVRPGEEKSFLAPLPVASVPELNQLFFPGKNELIAMLDELRLKLLGQVAAVPVSQLQLIAGAKARLLKQWAIGVDPSPVWSESSQRFFDVSHDLEAAEIDDDVLLALLYRLLERLCANLRKRNRFMRSITLGLQYTDGFELMKRQEFLPPTSWEAEIYPTLQRLFLSVERRVRILRISLAAEPGKEPAQLNLFPDQKVERLTNLTSAVDSIRERYGEALVWRGVSRPS